MMISLCMLVGDFSACSGHTMGASLYSLIREYSTAFLSVGVTLLILNCHQIDVVSGCGKNAEGALLTHYWMFHNLLQKL